MTDRANIVLLRDSTLRDIPATLRRIAEAIERGEHPGASGCVVVLDADRIECFYCGDGEAGPNAHLLLGAGLHRLVVGATEGKI
ncbi:MAG: hypothetical protein EBR82_09825 [Caulobacteraceae bacterium]|nr:hypothetical protein [Caulobacteraceae bacterium]